LGRYILSQRIDVLWSNVANVISQIIKHFFHIYGHQSEPQLISTFSVAGYKLNPHRAKRLSCVKRLDRTLCERFDERGKALRGSFP
jgi:hypothetical protein